MKTSEQWADIIISYMQKNPITSLESAKLQIKTIVEMVQEDIIGVASGAANDDEPEA